MNNNEWKDFGEQIKDAVDSAVSSGNFQDLSRSIGSIVNTTIDTVKTNVKDNVNASLNKQGSTHTASARRAPKTETTATPALYTTRPPGKVSAILLTIFGFVVMSFSLLLLFLLAIWASVTGTGLMGVWISGIFSILGLAVGAVGIKKQGCLNRFQKYIRLLQGHTAMQIEKLAKKTGKSLSFTQKELQKMITDKWFYEGHLDPQGGYLLLSHNAYEEYCQAKQEYLARKQEQEALHAEQELSAECKQLISDGEAYIRHIRTCNDMIPDVQVSEKLDKMEQVVSRIFEEVRRHPQIAPELQKMMDYYLPTTAKLLDAYRDLDTQPIVGEHISTTKQEIESAIDTLNVAFEKLLDNLFADRAWDISSDISVLHTVLAQEGLTEDDFKQS